MRGKVGYAGENHVEFGITPAYAGKRGIQGLKRVLKKDHPRLCGEKVHGDLYSCKMSGSPPPMRGKAVNAADVVNWFGITPAYAGKSFQSFRLAEW